MTTRRRREGINNNAPRSEQHQQNLSRVIDPTIVHVHPRYLLLGMTRMMNQLHRNSMRYIFTLLDLPTPAMWLVMVLNHPLLPLYTKVFCHSLFKLRTFTILL